MKKGLILLAILFSMINVSGFSVDYPFAGEHPEIGDKVPAMYGRHEKITENAAYFLCLKKGKDFINENLSSFLDTESISSCNEIKNSINSLKIGTRYNHLLEMDGFTAMKDNYWDEYDAYI